MSDVLQNDPAALRQARHIATEALAGRLHLFLACRDLADLVPELPCLLPEVRDTFVAMASETDLLPIGHERQHWEAAALRERDRQTAEYLGRVKGGIEDALQKLLLDSGC